MATSKYASFWAQLVDLTDAAQDRLDDAEAMFLAGRYASSIAMGIYSLEIHLKARICRKLGIPALPRPFEIHDLDGLLVLSGLSSIKDTASATLRSNWELVSDLADEINELRYTPSRNWNQADARAFFTALRDPPEGILPWLTSQP